VQVFAEDGGVRGAELQVHLRRHLADEKAEIELRVEQLQLTRNQMENMLMY